MAQYTTFFLTSVMLLSVGVSGCNEEGPTPQQITADIAGPPPVVKPGAIVSLPVTNPLTIRNAVDDQPVVTVEAKERVRFALPVEVSTDEAEKMVLMFRVVRYKDDGTRVTCQSGTTREFTKKSDTSVEFSIDLRIPKTPGDRFLTAKARKYPGGEGVELLEIPLKITPATE